SQSGEVVNALAVHPVPRGKVDVEVSTSQRTVDRLEARLHEDIFLGGKILAGQDTALTVRATSTARLSAAVLRDARRAFERQRGALSASVQPSPPAAVEREKTMQRQILGTDSAQSLLEATSGL